MADETTQSLDPEQSKPSSSRPTGFGVDFSFTKTASGILMIVNFALLFFAWTICAGWKDDVHYFIVLYIGKRKIDYFIYSTVTPWLLTLVMFCFLLFGLHKRFIFINWPLSMAINCGIWALLILISASLIASDANELDIYIIAKTDGLKAAAAFGFLSMVGLIAQAIFHVIEFRKS